MHTASGSTHDSTRLPQQNTRPKASHTSRPCRFVFKSALCLTSWFLMWRQLLAERSPALTLTSSQTLTPTGASPSTKNCTSFTLASTNSAGSSTCFFQYRTPSSTHSSTVVARVAGRAGRGRLVGWPASLEQDLAASALLQAALSFSLGWALIFSTSSASCSSAWSTTADSLTLTRLEAEDVATVGLALTSSSSYFISSCVFCSSAESSRRTLLARQHSLGRPTRPVF